jgi:hypothetical protein
MYALAIIRYRRPVEEVVVHHSAQALMPGGSWLRTPGSWRRMSLPAEAVMARLQRPSRIAAGAWSL